MITISAHVSKDSVERVRKALERKIAARQEQVALKVYNFIVTAEVDYDDSPNFGMPARTPFWSGAFASSWDIQSGTPGHKYNIAPAKTDKNPRQFERAGVKQDLNHTDYRLSIFITNRVKDDKGVGYANKIENYGTPYHEEPWKIATNASNVIKHMKLY